MYPDKPCQLGKIVGSVKNEATQLMIDAAKNVERGGPDFAIFCTRRKVIKKVLSFVACFVFGFLFIHPTLTFPEKLKPIQLLKPQVDGGKPLMQVLKDRKSSREFSNEKLPLQVLSNLLWAASGINRPDSEKRTAPSAANWQEIDIYVATSEGLYIYDAKSHMLNPVLSKDIRALTGRQPFVKEDQGNKFPDTRRHGESKRYCFV